jgi:hypothetical protein
MFVHRNMGCFLSLAVILVTGSCGSTARSSMVASPLLSDCLDDPVLPTDKEIGSYAPIDPQGQGSDLLGLGFVRANALVRVDRFDLERITDRNGFLIKNVSIDAHSHVLSGTIKNGLLNHEPADWSAATFVGRARCTSLRHRDRMTEVKVRVRGLSSTRLRRANLQTYQLELEDRGTIRNACRDQDDVAIAVNGYWDDTGAHVIDGKSFSFACTKRDVAACLDAGYVDDPRDSISYALFGACLRMLRADYCGNGTSYTKDGTFVTIYDNKKIAANAQLEPLVFEAAWSAKGAYCMARPRWPDKNPTCPTPIPACPPEMNRDTARGIAEIPLVFNESCMNHPCTVSRAEFDEADVSRAMILKPEGAAGAE